MLQVLDGVELDAALAQQFRCAARVASARVVIDDELFHAFPAPYFRPRWRPARAPQSLR
jgi:hypothetical protein